MLNKSETTKQLVFAARRFAMKKLALTLLVLVAVSQNLCAQVLGEPPFDGPVAKYSASMAGKAHPETGISYDSNGFPDFSKVAKKTVSIEVTGNHTIDFARANQAAGFDKTPKGFTWHHHQDCKTMQLVETTIHQKTPHLGGASIVRAIKEGKFVAPPGALAKIAAKTGNLIGKVGKVAGPVGIVIVVADVGIDVERRFEDVVDAFVNPNLSDEVIVTKIAKTVVGVIPAQVPFVGERLEKATDGVVENHKYELHKGYLQSKQVAKETITLAGQTREAAAITISGGMDATADVAKKSWNWTKSLFGN